MATARDAWIGLLETHKLLTRALDAELVARHGLGLSEVEALGRLAVADGQHLRISELAVACGLSLSRTSRLVDALEKHGLVERIPSGDDARVVDAHLTEAGRATALDAQATHLAGVQARFADHVTPQELDTLAAVFARFAPGAVESCVAETQAEAA